MARDSYREARASTGISPAVAKAALNLPVWYCFLALMAEVFRPGISLLRLLPGLTYVVAGAYLLIGPVFIIFCSEGSKTANLARFLFSAACLAMLVLGR
ncbi:MAG: hypothetical protein IPP14_16060 [Planctomycetes bacterium]|nr:hypothetical protein [Planctomycetota bacterium]